MKELKFLSEKYIDLDKLMEHKVAINFSAIKNDLGWNNCEISTFETGASWNYYRINFNKGKVLAIDKKSNCQLRRIEQGIFKDCYCVIELNKRSDEYTILYVFDKYKILKYPEFKKLLSTKQVDQLLDKKQVEKMTAKMLNSFDLLRRCQDYEIFCENLPDCVWESEGFAKNVLENFEALGQIKLQNDIDKKFVKMDLCKDAARQYFKKLSKTKEHEKTL